MRSGWLLLGCLVCGAPMVGCGGSSVNNFEQKVEMDFSAVIKSDLEAISKSGRLGSGYSVLVANVNALKEKDPQKGEALKKGLEELIAVQGPDKVKAKAKELMKLL